MSLSRNAQLVALIHFPTGGGNSVLFSVKRHKELPQQHREGLQDLLTHKMIRVKSTRSTIEYSSLNSIGFPMKDFKPMLQSESWTF